MGRSVELGHLLDHRVVREESHLADHSVIYALSTFVVLAYNLTALVIVDMKVLYH